jgi:phospholipase C
MRDGGNGRGRAHRWALALAITGLALVGGVVGSVGGTDGTAASPDTPAAPLPPSASPPAIHHVVLIMMENHARYQVLSGMPYAAYLAGTYADATHYYALCHPSVPNYLAETGGYTRQCGTDNYNVYNATNIGDLLQHAGLTWKAYLQSMPTPCDTGFTTLYDVHHNPMVYYKDVVKNASRCDSLDIGAKNFSTAIAGGHLPSLSIYSPNVLNDCHSAPLKTCNTWLQGFLGPILNSTRPAEHRLVAHTVFVIVFDESLTNDTSGYNGTTGGGHVFFVAVSPWSKGLTYSANATSYNLLSTIEWIFGLGSTGGHDGTSAFPAMKGLFT